MFCQLKPQRASEGFSHTYWEANQRHAGSNASRASGLSLGGLRKVLYDMKEINNSALALRASKHERASVLAAPERCSGGGCARGSLSNLTWQRSPPMIESGGKLSQCL